MKLLPRNIMKILPDKAYVRLLYLKTHGHFLHLRHPRTFNEKLQWYKLYYHDPLMVTLSDKYQVRKYLEAQGHGCLLNELYGVYDRVEEIDPDALPERFVIKATHGSNMNIICRDKRKLDWKKSCTRMANWLQTDYFYSGRQWAYKGIRPRLVCEKYLENEEFHELLDYKFYCYGGKPEVVFVCSGRYSPGGVKYSVYDMNWNRIYMRKGNPCSDLDVLKPSHFEAMVSIVQKLCASFPFIRVDLYSISGKLIFGEFTFYPDSGTVRFSPDRFNYFFGDLFVLPPGSIG
jgi:hypothetical protein